MKEIYESGDITLLTFYEFIWFEENYTICHGFLSALRNNIIYNLRMRNNINKIKNYQKPKIKRINKKEKIFNKKFSTKIFKSINNNKINFCSKKSSLRKTFIPYKVKNKNYFNSKYGKAK